jgi:Protein of unknown function DUF262
MSQEDQILDVIADEQNDYYSNDDLYNITSWGADLSFRELISQYEEGALLKPELQRHYVWDKPEASRFIDSVLLGLPIPSIFLAKTVDEKMLIIDGYQRIMTVYDFVRGIFAGDGKVFKLSNSEKINKRWRGKAFSELTESDQRKIRGTTIHAIIFVQKQPRDDDTSIYQVFERINTGGRTLLPQEIRNCVYQGSFNSLLIELNKNQKWRNLYGLPKPDSRMRDMEFILRFFALRSHTLLSSKEPGRISLKKYLNEFMGSRNVQQSTQLDSMQKLFVQVSTLIHDRFGREAFHNISPKEPEKFIKKFNPTIFDSIAISTCIAAERGIDDVEERKYKDLRLQLLHDEEYQDLIKVRTTDIDRIQKRVFLALRHLYKLGYE